MTTPKEITATEQLLDLIRTSPSPPVNGQNSWQESETNTLSGLSLEEVALDIDDGQRQEEDSPPPAAIMPETLPPSSPVVTNSTNEEDDSTAKTIPLKEVPSPSITEAPNQTRPQSSTPIILSTLQRLRPVSKTTIAIDIQPGFIHLVKSQSDKLGHTVLACQSVAYENQQDSPPQNLFNSPPFKAVLFSALSEMADTTASHNIWCSYAYCNPVTLHNVSIPKVTEKEIANAVFWSAKRELEFDESSTLFDYSILQEFTEEKQNKIQVLVSLVPLNEVKGVEAMFRDAGFPLTGLTFPAAATQNFINQDPNIPSDQPVAYFTIRKHNSFIDIFYKGKMFFSREIKTGTESFVESLQEQASQRNILIDDENVFDYLFQPRTGHAKSNQVSAEILALLNLDEMAVIDRLARQLMRTFEYCTTTFKIPPACKIFTSGEYTVNEPIRKAIESRANIPCAVLQPFTNQSISRALGGINATGPHLLVAAGLSLSDKQTTTNFLFTHADRLEERTANRINSIIAITTICLTIGCGIFFSWQYKQLLNKRSTAEALRIDLASRYKAEPRSRSNDYTNQSIQQISQFHQDNKAKVDRFKAVIMIGELTKKIPREITLTDLTLKLDPEANKSRIQPNAQGRGTMQLDGYINAPPEEQEFFLMNFLKSLATLDLLGEPDLQSKEETSVNGKSALRFEINLKTILNSLEPPAS